MGRTYFTICASNYLSIARTCLASIRAVEPDCRTILFLCDTPLPGWERDTEDFEVIEARSLGIAAYALNELRYGVLEFSTSLKPHIFLSLFRRGIEHAVYLDPDLYFTSAPMELTELFDGGASAVLTPHALSPMSASASPNDQTFLRVGAFNLGFLGLCNRPDVVRFLAWWAAHLDVSCMVDLENGLFTDQKWCDLMPCLLDDVRILRHPGYNVAYWNLTERPVSRSLPDTAERQAERKSWRVGDVPLRFAHFSGARDRADAAVSTHQPSVQLKDTGAFQDLAIEYFAAVHALRRTTDQNVPWAGDLDLAGIPIASQVKRLWRTTALAAEAAKLGDRIGDPDVRKRVLEQMVAYACSASPDVTQDQDIEISRLMLSLWDSRGDLRRTFALHSAAGRRAFVTWFERAARNELGWAQPYWPKPRTGRSFVQRPLRLMNHFLAAASRRVRHLLARTGTDR